MNQSSHLYRMQNIDSQLDKITVRLSAITTELANNHEVQEAENALKESFTKQEKSGQQLKNIDEISRSIRIKVEMNEASMYGGNVHNPKELQNLQNENASLKRRLAANEDEQLEAMLLQDEAIAQLRQAEKNLAVAKANAISQQSGLVGEQTKLQSEQARLSTEREGISRSILPENIKIYQNLREKKRGIAVSRIEDSTCNICGFNLRPAVIQEAKSSQQMAFCPSCGRVLFAG